MLRWMSVRISGDSVGASALYNPKHCAKGNGKILYIYIYIIYFHTNNDHC